MSEPALAGIVLCGGASRRMGMDKALLTIGGETLLDRTIRRLREVADPILIASGTRRLERPGCFTVLDAPGVSRGPLAGLVAGLEASPHRLNCLVAVDMPDLEPRLLSHLASNIGDFDASVPISPSGLEPLHAVYASSALPIARALAGTPDVSMHALLGRLRTRFAVAADILDSAAAERFARNLNSPGDLEPPAPRGRAGRGPRHRLR